MFRRAGIRSANAGWSSEAIREELFSIERLEQHAASLAAAQPIMRKPYVGRSLVRRLKDNAGVLQDAYGTIAKAIGAGQTITPASEWLVDNYHVVEAQIHEIRSDLPNGYYRELPKLADGPFAGYPRVFGITWAFVAHTDSRFDPDMLCRFVRAYQKIQPLTIGELWAVAITLRIVLVENLRRSAERIVDSRIAREQADQAADRLLGVNDHAPEPAAAVLGRYEKGPLPTTFAVQLVQRLRDQDPRVTPALVWLEQKLTSQGTTSDSIVYEEHQLQGSSNITVRNIITSMRLISAIDWTELFEKISLVDDMLRAESGFADMDFATRNRYRRAIEELSRGSGHTELDIARRALEAAKTAREYAHDSSQSVDTRRRDPGYHLIGRGRGIFETSLGFGAGVRGSLVRLYKAVGISAYVISATILGLTILAIPLLILIGSGFESTWLIALALTGAFPASDLAIALVNRGASRDFGAKILPGLALRGGVPPHLRTLIVMPTLLINRSSLDEQAERLETHFLANPEGDVYYALLTDWTDAATETAAGDEALLGAAADAIRALNLRHGAASGGERFLLLHRRRAWNEAQGRWMGWERKRGKLHELNRLLRGAVDTTFLEVGNRPPPVPADVRYVITLDADTRLPRETVRRLVGKMAHPLNQPRLDDRLQRVVEGYGILQPRVTPSLPTGREGSTFQRVFSSLSGIDPYAAAVSDVYQDWFEEGSFAGKGIYDVDAFEAALAGRIPENAMLSHDLFEGIFARAGLVSDIEVIEEFPSRYDVAVARHHRWARGDWQLLPWIFGRGPGKGAARAGAPLIGRWKMLDNLRRAISPPAAFLAVLAGWMLPVPLALVWTVFVLATIAIPLLLPVVTNLMPRRADTSIRSHLYALQADAARAIAQTALLWTFLADQAWSMSDAIIRTLYRLFISRRHLLEWVSAAQTQIGPELGLAGYIRRMGGSIALSLAGALLVEYFHPTAWPVAAPFVALWIVAPAIARWTSVSPLVAGLGNIDSDDATALRLIARRTWRFFETFVTAADNMLPPDNFQEDPHPVLAHRTSPTNLGLYLLSTLAARDFGWIGLLDAVERLEATMATMARLERCRGHFYNWYDTQDLRPLEPKYISSVDSGNLAGHLIALANACREMTRSTSIAANPLTGLDDALRLTAAALDNLPEDRRTQPSTLRHLRHAMETLSASLREARITARSVARRLTELASHAAAVLDIARALTMERGDDAGAELLAWAEATARSVGSHARDLEMLAPWALLKTDHAELGPVFDAPSSLVTLPDLCEEIVGQLHYKSGHTSMTGAGDVLLADNVVLADSLLRSSTAATALRRRLATLETRAREMAQAMKFDFLLDPDRKLLSIGFQVAEGLLDPSCYDLLASEARLASFIAIANCEVPTRHWFRLGRAVTPIDHSSALISWSGSMFEYLMPSLVMRAPNGSLLEQTSRLIVRRQISYGAELGVPWGISESAYNVRDVELTYQYSNFGVPGLGLKRGLSENIVIAPYATALATMVDPAAARQNFDRLAEIGAIGRYGFYEALDYTPARILDGQSVAIVRCHMAHHQGMTIVAIANALLDGAMRARFHAEPMVKATELLLQERTPRDVSVANPRAEEVNAAVKMHDFAPTQVRRLHTPHDSMPQTHLLSNGRYSIMLTSAGSGYSRWRNLAVTRWREDTTCDGWGSYIYLRNIQTGEIWSAGYQPSGSEPDSYEVSFAEDRADFVRRDGTIRTSMEVLVSPEDDAEVRRITLANVGSRARDIEITSYAELVLGPAAADDAHPAFSKMFVQTEYVEKAGALLATRRSRAPGDPEIWAAHLAVIEGDVVGDVQFETDRARFLGRSHGLRAPSVITGGRPLSNTTGTVLDPIFSLRYQVRLAPGTTVHIAFWTMAAASRAAVLDLADHHQHATAFDRAATLAWTLAQVQLRYLNIDADEAHLFQRLASHALYADPSLRPPSDTIQRGAGGQHLLWGQGISGDLPIVLVRIAEVEELDLVKQLLQAHEYWRMKQVAIDLVIINEKAASYVQDLQIALETLVRTNQLRAPIAGGPVQGTVFVLRGDLITAETRALLQSVARAVLLSRRGSLAEQLDHLPEARIVPPPGRPVIRSEPPQVLPPRGDLQFFNSLGGFSADGREYLTILQEGRSTPAPWINVIANAAFGFQVSTEGSGYTWSVNSKENQLTPWSNDPVSDRAGEAIYLRDTESGDLWTPTALPIRQPGLIYQARHGQGYSRFTHESNGIGTDLVQFVALQDPVKISHLRLRNLSGRTRRLSITTYVEWVLGTSRATSAPYIVTEVDGETGAMFARNPWSTTFAGRVAFMDMAGRQSGWTGDRREFIGRNGALDRPAAVHGEATLSKRVGAGLDPCGVLQTIIELAPDTSTEITILLGEAASAGEARELVTRYRATRPDDVLQQVNAFWDDVLGTVQVKTPDRSMDLMLNRWLLYQTLVCRIWARSAFYQASGAYGFRDQLQDGTALTFARPDLTREHILRAAGRQFPEGDMQHWWLPPTGQGVRTHISDDRVWLAYAVAHYVGATGDLAILDQELPYLSGPALRPGEHDSFFLPETSAETATLFQHCALGLDAAMAVGEHGLPLIGTGDWNDGMNRVGEGGKGESVWLAWFLLATIKAFTPLAEQRGETDRVTRWTSHAMQMTEAVETNAWDGEWYRRGYFDDGTPLGSAASSECRIDAIAQSWSVISGSGRPDRARQAMAAMERNLIRPDDKLALLFTPPFDKTPLEPGYIKGYPAGVRENGGQYSHAAIWSVLAFALQGDGDRATQLFAMLNPINHANTRAEIQRYKVEPYVIAADIYSVAPHVGRGGWTWYTGSAAWMYRVGIESILGLRLDGGDLLLNPCIPKNWPGFEMVFRHGSARYEISVENPSSVNRGVVQATVDGQAIATKPVRIKLGADVATKRVRLILG